MGQNVVLQPNGLLALFSSVVDNFTIYNCTLEEMVWGLVKQDYGFHAARRKCLYAIEHPDELDYKDYLKTVELVHGADRYGECKDQLTGYPYDEKWLAEHYISELVKREMDIEAELKYIKFLKGKLAWKGE